MVDIEGSYKSVPAISYDKYDRAHRSMQEHDWKSGARCRRRSFCIRRWDRNSRETYWEAPDMQNVQDITETVTEERVVEEIPPNTQEQVPRHLSMERREATGASSKHTGEVRWQEAVKHPPPDYESDQDELEDEESSLKKSTKGLTVRATLWWSHNQRWPKGIRAE